MKHKKSNDKPRLGRTIKILSAVSFFTDTSTEMIYPILPVFITTILGAGPAFLGVIEGIAEGTASILKGFSGYISDKLRKRKALIIAGYGLSTFTKPFFVLAQKAWQVVFVRFFDRVGKGIRTSPRDALIAESADRGIWGKAYGFHRAMDTLGAVVGPALGLFVMWLFRDRGRTTYDALFLAAFFPGLIAVLLLLTLREKKVAKESSFPSFKLSGLGKGFWMLIVVVVVFTLGNSSDTFLLLRAKEAFEKAGVSSSSIPLLIFPFWMTFNVVYSAVSIPAGILSDRIGRKKTLVLGFLLYCCIYVGFAFAQRILYLWLLIGAYGIFYGLTEGVTKAYVADLAPEEFKGTAFGLYHTTDGVCKLLASVIFGLIWQLVGPAAAFLTGASLSAIASIVLWLFCVERVRTSAA
ncbi:MAG: MFS transporter [Actinomycetota bacterium]|nr:MFS transporter [Actinomycetota bacterium]